MDYLQADLGNIKCCLVFSQPLASQLSAAAAHNSSIYFIFVILSGSRLLVLTWLGTHELKSSRYGSIYNPMALASAMYLLKRNG